jgi:hypothetical protein
MGNFKSEAVEIIEDKLYWLACKSPPNMENLKYFNIDFEYKYKPYN